MLMSIQLAAIMNEISRVVISLRALATRSVSSDTSSLVKEMFFERSTRARTLPGFNDHRTLYLPIFHVQRENEKKSID